MPCQMRAILGSNLCGAEVKPEQLTCQHPVNKQQVLHTPPLTVKLFTEYPCKTVKSYP